MDSRIERLAAARAKREHRSVEHESETTRWTLIRGAAAGSAEDRDTFARRYEPIVRAYLGARWRTTGYLGELDDAVQETFVACFRAGGALERVDPAAPGRFRSYLYGVVLNVARRFEERGAKRHSAKSAAEVDLGAVAAREESASRAFDRSWASSVLADAAELQAQRAAGDAGALRRVELLDLRFVDNLPIREIAARWGEDAAHVHREYARARREFRAALRDVVRTSSDTASSAVEAECERLIEYFR